jgi:pimeloyl-ACP methyl ester carboxylesterase/heme-degrading monooxygenase HmoA
MRNSVIRIQLLVATIVALSWGCAKGVFGDGKAPLEPRGPASSAATSRGALTEPASTDESGTIFLQTWLTSSRDNQDGWLATMRKRVGALTRSPGFISMSVHRADDGKRIVVSARWRSEPEFLAAVSSPEAKAGHDELAKWGTTDGGALYKVANVYGPARVGETDASSTASESALFLEAQRRWASRGFATRLIRVNGVSLHVAEGGQGDPVFLLHGYPQSGEVWRSVAPELARTHRVIIPDLRGMGLSEAAKKGYDLSNVAEDIHQIASSMRIAKVKVVGHDWGAAVGAVYALRYRDEVSKLAFLESALAGAGFEKLWSFSKPNDAFTFIPFLLMGAGDHSGDTTGELMAGRESIYLHHLWSTFTGDKEAAPFAAWAPYVAAMARPGIAVSSSSYYREAYESAEQVQGLIGRKLEIPVLAIAGERGIGEHHEALVRAFALNVRNLVVPGAGHFLAEERPTEIGAALQAFLAE